MNYKWMMDNQETFLQYFNLSRQLNLLQHLNNSESQEAGFTDLDIEFKTSMAFQIGVMYHISKLLKSQLLLNNLSSLVPLIPQSQFSYFSLWIVVG